MGSGGRSDDGGRLCQRGGPVCPALHYIAAPMRPQAVLPAPLRLFLAVLCVLLIASRVVEAQTAPANAPHGGGSTAQVLVIGGTDPYLPAFVTLDGAMRSAVAERHRRSVVWMHESIDTARFGGASGPLLADLLARKYESVRIDAVVLVTEPAVDFYLRYRDRLWPATPAVFHSVEPSFVRRLPPGSRLSGIPAEVDFAGALRIARALQPSAKRLVVVAEAQLAGARQALASFDVGLTVEYLIGRSPPEVAARLAGETNETIVLYASVFRDADGRVYVPRAVLETLAAASGAPIHGVFDSQMGYGLTSGAVESFVERGRRVADLLVRALDRPDIALIEPAPTSKCVADGRQLERFALSARLLPAGCEVRYVEPGFFDRYWWQSLLVTIALLAQSALIASLLLQRRRRRAAELSLQAQRVQLLHASRLAVAGELTASIAHEINQPLGAILSNADAAEMLVQSGKMGRDELLQILADIRRDDLRASEVIKRLRALLARHETERRRFDLNQTVECRSSR
jgi:signal transduction histidine kinase